jgi:hypothetical protein
MNRTHDSTRRFLRHSVATLAYRSGKILRDAPQNFGTFRVGETTRTPSQILAHVGDLLDWGLSQATGNERWNDAVPLLWDEEVARFYSSLNALDTCLASEAPLSCPCEQIFQGPIADALAHFGQLAMLRRLAGEPVRGENYAVANVEPGRVGPQQSAPRMEFERENAFGRIVPIV